MNDKIIFLTKTNCLFQVTSVKILGRFCVFFYFVIVNKVHKQYIYVLFFLISKGVGINNGY